LRQAFDWSLSDETAIEAAPRLALGSRGLWPTYRETIDWITKVMAWCDTHPQLPAQLHLDVLIWLTAPVAQDDPPTRLKYLQQAVDISRGLVPADKNSLTGALFVLGVHYLDDWADAASALPLVDEVEALILEMERDPAPSAMPIMRWAYMAQARAGIAYLQGRYHETEAQSEIALRLFQAGDYPSDTEEALVGRAVARRSLGQYALAREDLLQALSLLSRPNYYQANREAYITRWLAEVDLLLGDLTLARSEGVASLKLADRIPDYNIVASNLALAAALAAKHAQPIRAATLAGASQAMWARQKRKPWEDSSLDTLLPGWREGPEYSALNEAIIAGKAM